jgi:hypothetical protein
MFSQLTEIYVIREHTIYWQTIGDFDSFAFLQIMKTCAICKHTFMGKQWKILIALPFRKA